MHARTVSRLAGPDSPAVAFNNGQFGRTLGTLGQGVVGLGIAVATSRQFLADIMDDSLDRLGRDGLTTHLLHHDGGPLERAGFGAGNGHALHQQRSQFSGIKAQGFPEGGKSADGSGGNQPQPPQR